MLNQHRDRVAGDRDYWIGEHQDRLMMVAGESVCAQGYDKEYQHYAEPCGPGAEAHVRESAGAVDTGPRGNTATHSDESASCAEKPHPRERRPNCQRERYGQVHESDSDGGVPVDLASPNPQLCPYKLRVLAGGPLTTNGTTAHLAAPRRASTRSFIAIQAVLAGAGALCSYAPVFAQSWNGKFSNARLAPAKPRNRYIPTSLPTAMQLLHISSSSHADRSCVRSANAPASMRLCSKNTRATAANTVLQHPKANAELLTKPGCNATAAATVIRNKTLLAPLAGKPSPRPGARTK